MWLNNRLLLIMTHDFVQIYLFICLLYFTDYYFRSIKTISRYYLIDDSIMCLSRNVNILLSLSSTHMLVNNPIDTDASCNMTNAVLT